METIAGEPIKVLRGPTRNAALAELDEEDDDDEALTPQEFEQALNLARELKNRGTPRVQRARARR